MTTITEIEYDSEEDEYDIGNMHILLNNIYKNDDVNEFIKILESGDFSKYIKSTTEEFLFSTLESACTNGCENIIKLILEHQFKVKKDCNPIVYAICGTFDEDKKLNIVKALLDDKRFSPNTPTTLLTVSRLETPLTAAIKYKYLDIIKLLVEREDIDMNYRNECIKISYVNGYILTPLYYACMTAKDINIINYLLNDPRVDPNIYVGNLTVFQHTCNIKLQNSDILAKISEHLYNHPRIDADKLTKVGKTIFEMICGDHVNVVKKLI